MSAVLEADDARKRISAALTQHGAALTANGFSWDALAATVIGELDNIAATKLRLSQNEAQWRVLAKELGSTNAEPRLVVAALHDLVVSHQEIADQLRDSFKMIREFREASMIDVPDLSTITPVHLRQWVQDLADQRDAARRAQLDELAATLRATCDAAPQEAALEVVARRMAELKIERRRAHDLAEQLSNAGHELAVCVGADPARPWLEILGDAARLRDDARRARDEIKALQAQVAEMGEEMARAVDPGRVAEAVQGAAQYPHRTLTVDDDFDEIVQPRGGGQGGVTIFVDHPAGTMTWVLPEPRAAQFEEAIHAARRAPEPGSKAELAEILEGAPVAAALEDVGRQLGLARRMRAGIEAALARFILTPIARDPHIMGRRCEVAEATIQAALDAVRATQDDDAPFGATTDALADGFVEDVKERAAELVAGILTGRK